MDNKISELTVYGTELHGKWVVATNCAPYFCFEAETEDDAWELASEALKFFVENVKVSAKPELSKIDRFNPKNRIRATELACA